jgi:hypothetical protein
MKKPFDNQFATQRLLSEESATGGGVSNGATFTPGTGEQYSTTKAFKKKKNEVKDVEPKLAAGKAEIYPQKKWGWKPAPSIPNRPSKGGFQYKQMFEDMEEGVLQPVDLDKDSLSPMEYQQAQKYEKFDQAQWEFDDVSKRYIKRKSEAEKMMEKESIGLQIGDRVKVVYGNEFYNRTGTIEDIVRGFVVVDIDGEGEHSMHSSDVEKIEDEEEDEDYLNEALTYNKFKREAATRPNKDALHEALKSINKKLHEINKLMEYSANMRTELEEDYSPRTGKVVNKLERQLAEIYKKVKSLK